MLVVMEECLHLNVSWYSRNKPCAGAMSGKATTNRRTADKQCSEPLQDQKLMSKRARMNIARLGPHGTADTIWFLHV